MVYNEQKLESFSRRAFKYEEQRIIDTHEAIRGAISEHFDGNAVKEKYGLGQAPVLDIYLQGSYKNSTNVTKSSDVDLVVQLKTIWRANKESLPSGQLEKYNASYVSVSYPFAAFNSEIFTALCEYFGAENVNNDNKCLKIKEHDRYCSADVIPCFSYRNYGFFESDQNQKYTEGMFLITNDEIFIRNFPKQHYEALTKKSEATNGVFKATVRMFKNMRDDLIEKGVIHEGIAKSYFIENLLYDVPAPYFSGTCTDRFMRILDYWERTFASGHLLRINCANGIDELFAESNWKRENLVQFLIALIKVRNETEL